MSYEGYVQAICANDHAWSYDCYNETKCPHCGGIEVKVHSVDETNCCPEPRELIEIAPAVLFPLEERLEALYEARNLKEVASIIAEIRANVHGVRVIEPAKYKFGPIIPHKDNA